MSLAQLKASETNMKTDHQEEFVLLGLPSAWEQAIVSCAKYFRYQRLR
jgi:hypothetical protein